MATLTEELTREREAPGFHKLEDRLTTKIEQVTSKVPSGMYLAAAFGAIGLSAALALAGRTRHANFVGTWVPTILIMGLYNKLVKQHEPE